MSGEEWPFIRTFKNIMKRRKTQKLLIRRTTMGDIKKERN
jgi:hypothetical protein